MKTRITTMALWLLAASTAQAQYIIEKNNGYKVTVSSTKNAILTGSDASGWRVGGQAVSDVKSMKAMPLQERMDSYKAPTYRDYYRDISSWAQRSQWNLANVHDPSVMLAEDGYYYMYTTDASFGNAHNGHGHFMCRRSRNLIDWEFMGATMSKLPSWVKTKVNEIRKEMGLGESTANFNDQTQFGYWAPCARKVKNGLYRMYYCITMPGTINGDNTWGERAFIGLMETATPWNVSSWEDKGYVLTNASDKGLNFNVKPNDWANCYFKWNAIDPSYIITPEGEHWLIYGSWHSGFAAMKINADTGMPENELGLPWGNNISAYGSLVATRQKGNRWQGSEAPEVIYRNGYYYLFMAYDELSVAYNTRVVRSTKITGPYKGIDGTNVTTNGGDAFPIVTHPYKFQNSHGWVGISHCAVFSDGQDNWWYASQGRLPENVYNDAYSNAIMQGQVRRIIWTDNGWPVVMPECYSGVPQTPITEEELIGSWEWITLTYKYREQNEAVTFKLNADHKVEGGPRNGMTWSFNAEKNILSVGTLKLYLSREADWEASPRKATIVFAGISSKQTMWGKKVAQ